MAIAAVVTFWRFRSARPAWGTQDPLCSARTILGVPRYVERPVADAAGLRDELDLPWTLPYNLKPRDVFRTVEDLYEMLHEVNVRLHDLGYDRLEELLDPAGFSGLVSRSVVDRFERFSRALVRNRFHNGFPDLVPRGAYPGDSVQHGDRGGLEVKASRYEASWQSHGPRRGWFCVIQFEFDKDPTKALHDREPTVVRTALVAELKSTDWSWQPAREGRIRSGTASIRPSGVAKLRSGAVWVNPAYELTHQERLRGALLDVFGTLAEELVLAALQRAARPVRPLDVAAELSTVPVSEEFSKCPLLPAEAIVGRVRGALSRLVAAGRVERVGRGTFAPR